MRGHDVGIEGDVVAAVVPVIVNAGEEVIDGIRFSFEPVADAETTEQLAIGFPDERILIAPDVLYNGVHLFIGEHAFDAWETALATLEAQPYDVILPGHGVLGFFAHAGEISRCSIWARSR